MPLNLTYGCEFVSQAYKYPVYSGERPQILTGGFTPVAGSNISVGQWVTQDATTGLLTEIRANTVMTGKKPLLVVGLYDKDTKQNYGTAPTGTAGDVAKLNAQFWANKGNTWITCSSTWIKNNAGDTLVPFSPATHTALAATLETKKQALPDGTLVDVCAI